MPLHANLLRRRILALLVLGCLALASAAQARGGQAADDCPPGSKDPDCKVDARQP